MTKYSYNFEPVVESEADLRYRGGRRRRRKEGGDNNNDPRLCTIIRFKKIRFKRFTCTVEALRLIDRRLIKRYASCILLRSSV